MIDGFEVSACVDLGAFRAKAKDHAFPEFVERSGGGLDWIVLMEDRQPDFFLNYAGYDPAAEAPLNRHGPHADRWTHADMKSLVDVAHDHGVRVLLGYWLHECRFIRDRQPQLLMRDASGELWQNADKMNSDYNPLKPMVADAALGIDAGMPYVEYQNRQYGALVEDFGFDGLFLGDGGMGFRRFGRDGDGANTYDFDDAHIEAFTRSTRCMAHVDCALRRKGATTAMKANDVHRHHFSQWTAWNVERWTEYYASTAAFVHARGGKLAAYNTMNYGPALAYLHATDYRALAQAGLDYLVFQTYDYAWGPPGPFKGTGIHDKDTATNLHALLETRAHVRHDTDMKILFTTETEDSVEHWGAPLAHTLGEVYVYASARSHDGNAWRPAVDGSFVVWGNGVNRTTWRALNRAYQDTVRERNPHGAILEWSDDRQGELTRLLTATGEVPHDVYDARILEKLAEGGLVGAGIMHEENRVHPQPGQVVPTRGAVAQPRSPSK